MTEVSLIYYGNTSDVKEHLLFILNVLLVKPSTEKLHGFYISERRYGQETLKKAEIFFENSEEARDILIYRYLSEDEKKWLTLYPEARCYVVLHNMLDLQYICDLMSERDASYLADYADMAKIRKAYELRKKIESKKIMRLLPAPTAGDKTVEGSKKFYLPATLLMLLNALLNPAGEMKRYSVLLKYSQLRLVSQFLELFVFVHYVFVDLLLKPVYYLSVNLYGKAKVLLIKLGYFIRHVFLMLGFKSFGVFIDSLNLVKHSKVFLIKLGYFIRHVFLMLGFKSFGVFIDSLNLVKHSKVFLIKLGYFVRHIFLMLGFKSFGVFIDSLNLVKHSKIFFIRFWFLIVRIGYFVRHVFLMLGFKSFGVFIDSLNLVKRSKVFFIRMWFLILRFGYFVRHVFLMTYYKSYGGLIDFMNFIFSFKVPGLRLFYFVRHLLVMGYYKSYGLIVDIKNFILAQSYYRIPIFFKYTVWHYVKMTYYKIYGLSYDFLLLTYKVIKLYLLWPVFKIYWFVSFQYNKRIKKNFKS